MRNELSAIIRSVPRLDIINATRACIPCKICGSSAKFFDVVDFNKSALDAYQFGPSGITLQWFRCGTCEFLFTNFFDDWSVEDFSRFVYNDDYALVDPEYSSTRPMSTVTFVSSLLGAPSGLRILDYGSGAGLFVRGLLERGYDASGYDPFTAPERPKGVFDVIVCFEVIEHATNPLGALRDMRSLLAVGGGILVGQTLQPPDIETTRCNWWYCAPRNGHCSTFTARSLAFAAERAGELRFHPCGGHHAFTSAIDGRVTELLVRGTGPQFASTLIGAPAEGEAPGWHGIEQGPSGPFRWTSQACVAWRHFVGTCNVLELQIPVSNVLQSDFLQQCRVVVDGHDATTRTGGLGLVAEVSGLETTDGWVTVELHTSRLRTPREVHGSTDDRLLGLAVAVL